MGTGIAQACATAGLSVIVRDIDAAALKRCIESVSSSLSRLVSKQKLTEEAKAAALAAIKTTTELKQTKTTLEATTAAKEKAEADVATQTKRAEILNNFAQAKHTSIFESVDLTGKHHVVGEKTEHHLIQKLMSVPVIGPNGVLGVIEVCRKGTSAPTAGADFMPADMQKLVMIAGSLLKCFAK